VGIGSVKIPVDSFVRLSRILLMSAEADVPNELTGTLLILRDIRAPRVLVSLVIGATLGVCGAAMQGIFRNPLASPYLLGVASGANMGAALSIVLGVSGLLSGLGLPIGAFLGGLLAVSTVYGLSQARITGEASNTLILAGVALGALFTAVTSFLVFLSGSQMVEIIIWMMGSMGRGGWEELAWLTPVGVLGSALLIYRASDLNALALGDMGAHHLGIAPERTRRRIAGTVTVMTAAAVAVSGTIGFVGLVTPHAVRLIAGPDHRLLLPASALAGALFLLVADTVARTILSPVELPVGIITAVLGAPFFLYLLIHRSGGRIR
jgi:iron complex transport system permease protein